MQLADVEISNPDNYVNGFPYQMFDVLRRESPVHYQEDAKGPAFWSLTKHADVVAASRDPVTFSSYERTSFMREPQHDEELAQQRLMLVNMDPPEHTRLRNIVNKGFTPRMTARLEARIREFVDEIIERATDKGEGDFVREVAAELPLEVIAEVMGAPLEDRAKIFDLSNRLIGFDDPEFQTDPGDALIAATEMYLYANELGEQVREHPRDDIVSKLRHAEVDGHHLDELEFDLFFLLLSVAGNETTRNAIAQGMLAFLENPDQWQRLRDDPGLADSAAEEIVRWAHPVNQFRRTAMRDVEIRGQLIPEGSKVILWYPSANRDEDVFTDPYTFDIGRDPNPHISFGGGGPHYCLGRHLAHLEIKVMFEVLSQRLPDIQLNGEVRRLRSNFINGLKEMPVRFTP